MHVVGWQIYLPQFLKVTKHCMPGIFTKNFSEEVGESLETQWAVWKAEFAAKWAENSIVKDSAELVTIGESLFTLFASLTYLCLSLSDDTNKIKTLNIERA